MNRAQKVSGSLLEQVAGMECDLRAVAGIISAEGERLVEDGFNPANVHALVSFQLKRLIDGNITRCINPGCNHSFTLAEQMQDPLKTACSEDCQIAVVKSATEKAIMQLSIEIPQLQKDIVTFIKEVSSSAVNKGDEADMATGQMTNPKEVVAARKILRLSQLKNVLAAIQSGNFSMECGNPRCDEEIPLPGRIHSPEIGFCLACQAERRHR
ncbi:MAG TPA: hypothetical protein VF817_01455 [Patescibacteria group bacterium]